MGEYLKSESEIRQRYQTTIPQEVREKMRLEIGDSLIWSYDLDRDEIRIIKKPKSFSESIWNLASQFQKGKRDVTAVRKGDEEHGKSDV